MKKVFWQPQSILSFHGYLLLSFAGRHICLGFVHNYTNENTREEGSVDGKWVKDGSYEVVIAGIRFPADVSLNSPVLPPSVNIMPSSRITTDYSDI